MPLLAYWEARGSCQPIRLLLEYQEVLYDEKLFPVPVPPTYDHQPWTDVRDKLGLHFPNLPYYIDGPVKLTGAQAILRHLGRKHGLEGETEGERIRIDVSANQLQDWRKDYLQFYYAQNNPTEYLNHIAPTVRQFSKFLGDRPWLAGDYISYVDFVAYELLDQHLIHNDTILNEAKNLKELHDRLQNIPSVRSYLDSPRNIKCQLNTIQESL